TGSGVFGELYMVEFDGATPSAPILLNPPEQPVLVNSFQFEQLGRVLFRFGSGNDVVGIGRVEVAGGLAGSVEVVSESLPPGAEIDSFIRRSDRLVYQVSDPGTQTFWLSLVDLGGPVASEPVHIIEGLTHYANVFFVPELTSRLVLTEGSGA